MAAAFFNSVSLDGYHFEDSIFTYNLTGTVDVTDRRLVGAPVSIDTTARNSVKIAGDGDEIYGRIESVEKRDFGTVAGVALRWSGRFEKDANVTINVGQTVIGAGGRKVKAANAYSRAQNTVVEVGTDYVVTQRV